MKRQIWIWLGLSLAACGDDGSSSNGLATTMGNATAGDGEVPSLKSDAAVSDQAEQKCVQLAAQLCAKGTDCASTNGALLDEAEPASLSSCQTDTEASLGCGKATYIGPGYPACQDAINASTCADALSASNLPDECSGVIVLR